jgi:tetratricopeptide (TPR) repeat protein
MKPFIYTVLFFVPLCAQTAGEFIETADSLYDIGGLENYRRSIDLYVKAVKLEPENYEANWKCARAYREHATEIMHKNLKNWKDTCAVQGKIGMRYAQKAKTINPQKPEGHFYYGLNVGVYSDGVSIFTALKEGLKNKTQRSLEKAYKLDKTYLDAGPPFLLGYYWAHVPWPFRDRKKALKFYREYQKLTTYTAYKEERLFWVAELLVKLKTKGYKDEARKMLQQAVKTQDAYVRKKAEKLLKEISTN